MSRHATVTVAITTYNQASFLERTLQSVFAQKRPPDEILVVDDGSTDGTPALLRRLVPSVRTVRQRNGGVARARNRAVVEATGDLIAFLDGDDLWAPEKLELCLEAFAARPAAVIVHDVEMISEDGTQVLRRNPVRDFLVRHIGAAEPARLGCWEALIGENFIWTTSQVLIDRRLYLDAGMSDARFRVGSDYDLYLRLSGRTEFLFVPDVLAQWRQHDTSASGAGADRPVNWLRETVRVLRTHAAASDPRAAELARRQAAKVLAYLNCELYCGELRQRPWPTALRFFRVAAECRDVSSAVLGLAILCPPPLRHAAAVLTGRSVSTSLSSNLDRLVSPGVAGDQSVNTGGARP